MMSNTISVFLPTRKGSKRVINKNTRQFASHKGGLLELKLNQLVNIPNISEIVLSTNDQNCIEIGKSFLDKTDKLKIIIRPDSLASDSTDLVDLIKYVPTICSSKNILWTHVTSPFVDSSIYDDAINKYFESVNNGNDSLMSVKSFKSFLWSKDKQQIINKNSSLKWPRSQDLQDLYEIDSAIFISKRESYLNDSDRIGKNPFLYLQDKIHSLDIDNEDDFTLAEYVFNSLVK